MKRILCVLFLTLGMIAIVANSAKCETTTTIKPVTRIEYHNSIVEEWTLTYFMRLRYGTAKTQEKKYHFTPVSDENPTSSDTTGTLPKTWRTNKRRKGEHYSSQSRASRSLASTVRSPQLGGNYHSAYTGSSFKRQMYQTAGAVSCGGL